MRERLRIVIAFVVTVVAFAIHRFTITRIATWQPGYPGFIELGLFTPPPLMHTLHTIGPLVLIVACVAFAIAAVRQRATPRGTMVVRAAALTLFTLFVLYSWTLLWVVRVSRYVRH